ncbi:MAG: MerR family transcriptional regulator [Deltaproteobacteria bacterium]|nr:MerR family transcriptional regulator [Deltaproteobacteria bacterium]
MRIVPQETDSTPSELQDPSDFLSTGDMARITGNSLRTVRFYEEAGILRPERRSNGGHRLFSKLELERLRLITNLRAAGLSLDEIRVLLDLKEKSSSPVAASLALIQAVDHQLAGLEERIAVLTHLRDEFIATRTMLKDCKACTDTGFPEACGSCEKLAQRELPASMRVLWGLRPSGADSETKRPNT